MTKHGFPPTNRRADRMDEWDTRTVPASLYQLSARQLERAITIGGVRIQQWLSADYQNDTLLRQLRNKPRTSAHHTYDD